MLRKLRGYLYAALSAMVAGIGAFLYAKGRSDAKRKMEVDDYENAEDIRRRVSVDRADELRKYDDAGWRD